VSQIWDSVQYLERQHLEHQGRCGMQADAVGVVGLGVMGSSIAGRLLEQGLPVAVHDVRADARARLADRGAVDCPSPASLVGRCDVVVLSLNTADIVRDVVLGDAGLLSGLRSGRRPPTAAPLLLVDMSSIDPVSTRGLAAAAADHGVAWVDAPLSGGAPAAATGRLTLMVGGETVDVERARGVLSHLADRITHLGPTGSGQVVKLVNQVLVGAAFSAMAEAAALVRAEGIDPTGVLGALSGGRADSALLQEFFVKFATGDLTPTGRIANMVKDLDTARDHARGVGVPLPLTSLVCELNRWLVANGHGDADSAALMGFFDARLLPAGGAS
jgi:2-hydroxy-3-oxopropionate reductase